MNLEPAVFASVATSGVALCLGTLSVAGTRSATSVAVGAGIALLNLWALRGIVSVIVGAAAAIGEEAPGRSSSGLGFFLGPKLLALFGLVWLLLARHLVAAGPLAIGYAALPIGVVIGALVCKKAG